MVDGRFGKEDVAESGAEVEEKDDEPCFQVLQGERELVLGTYANTQATTKTCL